MKKLSSSLFITLAIIIASCSNAPKTETAQEKEKGTSKTTTIEPKDYIIINNESEVAWSAQGVGHGHNGTVDVISGKFSIKDGRISRGGISIDMTSIIISDIKDPEENKDLNDHLKGTDFFDVSGFPNASLEIIDASEMDNVKANMTIKDETREIMFPISVSVIEGNVVLKSKLKIDRTKFGVIYSSGNFFKDLGDHLVEDIIDLNVTLVAK